MRRRERKCEEESVERVRRRVGGECKEGREVGSCLYVDFRHTLQP